MRRLALLLSARKGYVIDWKIFGGYGFIQEEGSGNRYFCPRKATNGALCLRGGCEVLFEVSTEEATQSTSGLPTCSSVTDAMGKPFPEQEIQGIIVEPPVPSKNTSGVIRRVENWSPNLGSHAPTNLYHYSYSHTRELRVGDMVRFWSEDNHKHRTAKDVVAVDPRVLSPEELRLLNETRAVVLQRSEGLELATATANKKFQQQQRQPYVAGMTSAQVPGDLETSGTSTECEVIFFQGRYGKLRVISNDVQLIVFFHTDMVRGVPASSIKVGMKGSCTYEKVRQGKNIGSLRAFSVLLSR